MKKVFDTTEKMNLILGTETFVYNYRGQTFPVVLGQVCAHCSRDFGPLWPTLAHFSPLGPLWPILAHSSIQIFSRSFRFRGCRWATRSFSSVQRFSIGFRSGDWLGHSRTLKCFLRSHSSVALAQPRTTREDLVNDLKRAGTTVSKITISNTLRRHGLKS